MCAFSLTPNTHTHTHTHTRKVKEGKERKGKQSKAKQGKGRKGREGKGREGRGREGRGGEKKMYTQMLGNLNPVKLLASGLSVIPAAVDPVGTSVMSTTVT